MYMGMFSSAYARRGVPHICVLITDGESEDTVATEAEARHARDSVSDVIIEINQFSKYIPKLPFKTIYLD